MLSRKRKRETDNLEPDNDLKRKFWSSPRIEIVPGVWRRIVRGRRGKNDAKEWTCTCGYVNRPRKHVFFDVPQFKCGRKGCEELIPNDYTWKFSLADILANEVCPLGNVKAQNLRPHCMLFSSAMATEVTDRITRILLEEEVKGGGPFIDLNAFLKQLRIKKHLKRSVDMEFYENLTIDDLWRIFQILKENGVVTEILNESAQRWQRDFPYRLSSGLGRGFPELKANEIYVPPEENQIVDGKSEGLHSIVLFGGGIGRNRLMYYRFVNTHSEEFCELRRPRKDGLKGGFGNVIAKGILLPPVKLIRCGKGIRRHAVLLKSELTPAAPGKSRYIRDSWSAAKDYKFVVQSTKAVGRTGITDVAKHMQTRLEILMLHYRDSDGLSLGPFSVLEFMSCFESGLRAKISPSVGFSTLKPRCLPRVLRVGSVYLQISEYGSINKNVSEIEDENHFLECPMPGDIQNPRAETSSGIGGCGEVYLNKLLKPYKSTYTLKSSIMTKVSHVRSAYLELSDYGPLNKSSSVTEVESSYLVCHMPSNMHNPRAETTSGMNECCSTFGKTNACAGDHVSSLNPWAQMVDPLSEALQSQEAGLLSENQPTLACLKSQVTKSVNRDQDPHLDIMQQPYFVAQPPLQSWNAVISESQPSLLSNTIRLRHQEQHLFQLGSCWA